MLRLECDVKHKETVHAIIHKACDRDLLELTDQISFILNVKVAYIKIVFRLNI